MSHKSTKFDFRWGLPELDDEGYVHVYGFMLRNYARAGITRDEFLCIIHLAAYHYNSTKGQSRPSLATIAKEMGYGHENSVRRLVKSLEEDKKMLAVTRRDGKPSVYDASGFANKMLAFQQAAACVDGMVKTRKRATPTPQCTPPLPTPTPTSECVPPLPCSVGEEVKARTKRKEVVVHQPQAAQQNNAVESSTTTAALSSLPKPAHFSESLSLLKRIGIGDPTASLIASLPHSTPAFIDAHAKAWVEERNTNKKPPRIGILIVRLENGERVPLSEKPLSKAQQAALEMDAQGYRRPS